MKEDNEVVEAYNEACLDYLFTRTQGRGMKGFHNREVERPMLFRLLPKDLKGKRVGIYRGVSCGEVFDSARRASLFEAEEATDDQANLKKLIMGRLEGLPASLTLLSMERKHADSTLHSSATSFGCGAFLNAM